MAGEKLVNQNPINNCAGNESSQALIDKVHGQDKNMSNNNASDESISQNNKSSKSPNFVRRSEWISLAILTFVNLINYIDRYTIAGKVQCYYFYLSV